jgi:hypothetical protein
MGFPSADCIDSSNDARLPCKELDESHARQHFLEERDSFPADGVDYFAHAKKVGDDEDEAKEAEEQQRETSQCALTQVVDDCRLLAGWDFRWSRELTKSNCQAA